MVRFWWQEGCRGDLLEKRLGAVPCWTQPAPVSSPVDTSQDAAEPIRGVSGASVKIYLGKGRKHWTGRGGGKKRVRKTEETPRLEEEEEDLQAPEQIFPSSPRRGPHQSRWILLKERQLVDSPHWKRFFS